MKIDHVLNEKTSFDVYSEMFKRAPLEINTAPQPIPIQSDKVKLNKKLAVFKRQSAKIDELLKRKFRDSNEDKIPEADEARLQIVPQIKQDAAVSEDCSVIPFHNFGMESGDNLYNSWSLPRVVKARSSKKKSKKIEQSVTNEPDQCATGNLIDFSMDLNEFTPKPMFDEEIMYPEAFYTTSIVDPKLNELVDKKESLHWHKETNSYLFRPDSNFHESNAAVSIKYFAPDSLKALDQVINSLEHISMLVDTYKSRFKNFEFFSILNISKLKGQN